MNKNLMILATVVLSTLIPLNSAQGVYICPAGLDNPETVDGLKTQYVMMTMQFEDEILRIMDEHNTSNAESDLADFIIDEKGKELEDIGLAAKCLMMSKTDPNLIQDPAPEIISLLKPYSDRVQLVAPNYATYLLSNTSPNTCNSYLVSVIKEEYQSKMFSVESDLDVLLGNEMRANHENLDMTNPDVRTNLFNKIFSDPERKTDLIENFEYLKTCGVSPETLFLLSSDLKSLFNHDLELGTVYLIFPYGDLPPKKQSSMGVDNTDIKCSAGKVVIIKISDDSPACTNFRTAEILEARGWGNIISETIQ